MDAQRIIASLFGRSRALIGMIHVGALSGSPRHAHDVGRIADEAVREARILEASGLPGLVIEN